MHFETEPTDIRVIFFRLIGGDSTNWSLNAFGGSHLYHFKSEKVVDLLTGNSECLRRYLFIIIYLWSVAAFLSFVFFGHINQTITTIDDRLFWCVFDSGGFSSATRHWYKWNSNKYIDYTWYSAFLFSCRMYATHQLIGGNEFTNSKPMRWHYYLLIIYYIVHWCITLWACDVRLHCCKSKWMREHK